MNAWLMDVYRKGNSLILWIKTPEKDVRVVRRFQSLIYVDVLAKSFLEYHDISFRSVRRKTYLHQWKEVLEVPIPALDQFERFIRDLERGMKHRIAMYDADIVPEQMFLYQHDLLPCGAIAFSGEKFMKIPEAPLVLSKIEVCVFSSDVITAIHVNDMVLDGDEKDVLKSFVRLFRAHDPDVLFMHRGFALLPFLIERLAFHGLHCNFNRWDEKPITYRGGNSFFSYGRVLYRDFAVRLQGRFLVDTSSTVGLACDVEAIVELCHLSGSRFQQVASRSFGASFQAALVKAMVQHGFLVPFKEKPIDKPASMFDLFKADRAGQTLDPAVGFHADVAEVDFCSMFPWLMHNHNISADCVLATDGPFEHAPDIHVKLSRAYKGLIPIALKPFIDRRMEYKRNPTRVNKARAVGLKGLLVSSYGYLRFREFKLGIASSHMAICAYAREIILQAVRLAEEKGFEIVHGIVDSLYIKKKGITEEEVREFCSELGLLTGIPVDFEGIFKWIVFLPSINEVERPLPACYYGVFSHGGIKARGIEVRQASVPFVVKDFQQQVLSLLAEAATKKEIIGVVPSLLKLLRSVIASLGGLTAEWLSCYICLRKTSYASNIPQRAVVRELRKRDVVVRPGQYVQYVFQEGKVVLPDAYNGQPDVAQYTTLLVRALFRVLQPFGITRSYIEASIRRDRQMRLSGVT